MTAIKEQLGVLIEAYAAARGTGNSILIQSAGTSLVQFIDRCDITEAEAAEPEPTGEALADTDG